MSAHLRVGLSMRRVHDDSGRRFNGAENLPTGSSQYRAVLDGRRLDVRAMSIPTGYSLTASAYESQTNYRQRLTDG